MAFPGTGLGDIYGPKNTLSLEQWIKIINSQNKIVYIHKQTDNIALFTNANSQQALEESYEEISFENIEKIVKEKINECKDNTLIQEAKKSLENLKKTPVSD